MIRIREDNALDAGRMTPQHHPPHPFPKNEQNIGTGEQAVSLLGGAGLVAYGLRQRGITGLLSAAAGGVLLYRGFTQHCDVYESLGVHGDDASAASAPWSRDIASRHSVSIDAPASQLYQRWSNVEDLKAFFLHITNIEALDDKRSRWTAQMPADKHLQWESIITEDRPNERLAWKASDDAPFKHVGAITFREQPHGRGTSVTLDLQWNLPGGAFGAMLAKLMGRDPAWESAEALRRFKQLIETGEVASARGPAARDEGWNGHSLRESALGGTRERPTLEAIRAKQSSQTQADSSDTDTETASTEHRPQA